MKTLEELTTEIEYLLEEVRKTNKETFDLRNKAKELFDGKYAIGKERNPFYGMGETTACFVYPEGKGIEEAKEKEHWLIEKGYYKLEQYSKDCLKQIDKLEEDLCWVKYGMCQEERKLVDAVEYAEECINRALKKVEKEKNNLEKAKKELAEYRANKK